MSEADRIQVVPTPEITACKVCGQGYREGLKFVEKAGVNDVQMCADCLKTGLETLTSLGPTGPPDKRDLDA